MVITERKCGKCGVVKLAQEFHKDKTRKGGFKYDCKLCVGAAHQEWTRKNASRINEYNKRRYAERKARGERYPSEAKEYKIAMSRKTRHGITQERYEEMLREQNNVCAICGQKETARGNGSGSKSLSVDHCHATGQVRGLLCHACNVALGLMKDDTARLSKAIEYLSGASTILETEKWQP